MNLKSNVIGFFLLGLFFCLLCFACNPSSEHYDVLINGAKIVDGTGKQAFKGNVAINGEKIVAVGRVKGDADIVIDGTGLIACPGFVDTHSHGDRGILRYPLAENFVMQGVTMILGGNCGGSAAPTTDITFGQWLSRIDEVGISINFTSLVGHRTVRGLVMGREDFRRNATEEETERMKLYVEEAMMSGAFGLSGWHDPTLGDYASVEEVVEVAKIAQKYGGLYSPHTRNHQNNWFSEDPEIEGYGILHQNKGEVIVGRYHGLMEAVEISKKANIPVLIAHFTPAYIIPQPQPEYLQEAAARATLEEIIDPAWEAGLKVYFNAIACPYSIGGQAAIIDTFLRPRGPVPDWFKGLKKEEFLEKLETKEFRAKIREVIYSGRIKIGMIHPLTDPYWIDCYEILTSKNQEFVGKTLGDIARQRCPDNIIKAVYDESIETLFDLLIEDPDITWALISDKREYPGALPVFFKHKVGMPCIDCGTLSAKIEDGSRKPAPIYYGLFPLYIDTYVKKRKALTLEEAINRATYLPAQEVLGLKDRGIIAPEAYADIVVFSLEDIKMVGDYINPNIPPDGIEYVLVNGKVVYKDKTHTGEKPGKVVRHQF